MTGEENNFPEAVNSQSFSPFVISSAAKRPATDGINNALSASMGAPCTDGANSYCHLAVTGEGMYPAVKLPLRPRSPRYTNKSESKLGVCAASPEDAWIDSVVVMFIVGGTFEPQADSNMEMKTIHVYLYLEIIGSSPRTASWLGPIPMCRSMPFLRDGLRHRTQRTYRA